MAKLYQSRLLEVRMEVYLIHLVYKPEGTPRKKVAIVGKGLTFDSGGYNIKP